MSDDLLKEKRELKQKWSNRFLNELDLILEKCFLIPKKKKEHFITKEKLEIELIRLLQSQKQFTSLKEVKEDLKSLAVYDVNENIIGRIISINLFNETVEFETLFGKIKEDSFNNISFFNFNSLECVKMFDKQKLFGSKFTYQETYRFLMSADRKAANKNTSKKYEYLPIGRVLPVNVKVKYD